MKLSEKEINQVLTKIKTKYSELINAFSKPKTLFLSFEERYINVLKNKQDVSSFLIGEIQALEDFYNKEEEKRKIEEEKREARSRTSIEKSFADKIMEENLNRIQKYPRISISSGANEELERLFGAVRNFIINFYPVLTIIYKNETHNYLKNVLNSLYHSLIVKFDFKDDIPLARNYAFHLNRVPVDNKKVETEYYYILKESAFLLNEIYDLLKNILNDDKIPGKDEKFTFFSSEYNSNFTANFSGMTRAQSFDKVLKCLECIILDFRIKDIKKNK